MVHVDIGIKIPANFTLAIHEKILLAMGEVDIGPRPATIPPITHVNMIDCCIYLVLLAMWMIVSMKIKEVIVGLMVQDLELGFKISDTLPFTIMEKVLMVMGEVDLGIRPSPIPTIIQL